MDVNPSSSRRSRATRTRTARDPMAAFLAAAFGPTGKQHFCADRPREGERPISSPTTPSLPSREASCIRRTLRVPPTWSPLPPRARLTSPFLHPNEVIRRSVPRVVT